MLDLITFIVLSAASYRIGRFMLLDDLVNTPRDKLFAWLSNPEKLSAPKLWVTELITCTYCFSVWVAAAAVVFWSLVVHGEWIGWEFLLVWPAVATGSLLFWTYIDSEG